MTMTIPTKEQDPFQSLLERLYVESINTEKSPFLQKIRSKAWDHFLELGLPDKRTEVFRYIRLKNLYSQTFLLPPQKVSIAQDQVLPHIYPECKNSLLVFVNGQFNLELSNLEALPKRLVITSLVNATRTYGALLNNQWAKTMKEETDPFAILNAALHSEGAFVYLPPKSVIETPIQILHLIDAEEKSFLLMPRLHVFLGAQSEAHIYSTQARISGKNTFTNQLIDFSIEDDAHIKYIHFSCGLFADAWHFDAMRAHLKRNSTLKTILITEGSKTVRHDYRVVLAGENAEALLNGVAMLSEKREAHAHVLMEHQAPNCHSMQLFKNALNDASRSGFEGKILVRQLAQKTEAYQLNQNLMLSDAAHADSKPNLEIFADDVKASHGATVGQLDQEQLFYMKTRGFSEVEAKTLLVYGFCKEVIDMMTLPSALHQANLIAKDFLTKKHAYE